MPAQQVRPYTHCKGDYGGGMQIELRQLRGDDVAAHNAGEDEATVHWLTGGHGTVETTAAHFEMLAANLDMGEGKRGFGVWLDGRLAGYVDCDPSGGDGLGDGDVNISYAVHPWARGRGVAGAAVELMCEFIRQHRIGRRAVIRVEPENLASVRVAEKAGFRHVGEVESSAELRPDGTLVRLGIHVLKL